MTTAFDLATDDDGILLRPRHAALRIRDAPTRRHREEEEESVFISTTDPLCHLRLTAG
jgi:hypothetical protein